MADYHPSGYSYLLHDALPISLVSPSAIAQGLISSLHSQLTVFLMSAGFFAQRTPSLTTTACEFQTTTTLGTRTYSAGTLLCHWFRHLPSPKVSSPRFTHSSQCS